MNENPLDHPRWLRHPRKKIACCVAIGLLMNVAIAWTCDILYQAGVLTHSKSGAFQVGGVLRHDGTMGPIPQVVEQRGFAVRRVQEGIAVISKDRTNIDISQQSDAVHAGWPWAAFSRAWMQTEAETPPPGWWFAPTDSEVKQQDLDGKWRNAWQLGTITISQEFINCLRPSLRPRPYFLAIEPRPVGLLANTLLFAPVLALIVFARDIRRYIRLRHGRCTRCGYNLVGLARCPECGDQESIQVPPADHAPSMDGATP
jgi:hypothetical protein